MSNDSAHGRAVGAHPGSFSGGESWRWTSWAQTAVLDKAVGPDMIAVLRAQPNARSIGQPERGLLGRLGFSGIQDRLNGNHGHESNLAWRQDRQTSHHLNRYGKF